MPDLDRPRRPPFFTLLAALQLMFATALVAWAVPQLYRVLIAPASPRVPHLVGALLIALVAIAAVLHVVCGIGLLKLRHSGWALLRIWAVLLLVLLPIGTIIGILLLSYLNSPGVRLLYSERPLGELSETERRDLSGATQSLVPLVAAGVMAGLLALFVGAAIVTVRLVPDLFQLSGRGEASAIATLQRFAAAEAAYAAANGGRFGTPECLSSPATCIPGYDGFVIFTESRELAFQKDGYVFQFFSPETIERRRDETAPPRHVERFALLALPAGRVRLRMFCVDGEGVVRATPATRQRPSVLRGVCPQEWPPLHPATQ
jgi:hypothetical protein